MRKLIFVTVLLGLFCVSTAIAEPGDTLWTRKYGGSATDLGYSVQQTADGGFVIAGQTDSFGAGNWDVYLLKTDANGDTLWTRTYGGSDWDEARSVQQTTEGGYIIAGYSNSFGGGYGDLYLVKTDANGDTLWTRTYGGPETEYGRSVQQTSDGGYIVSGNTNSWGAGNADVWLLKTDANGDTLWTRIYGGYNTDVGYSVQETTDGGYIVGGCTWSFGAGLYDLYLLKTDANGDTLWTHTYGGSECDEGYAVQQTTDGGYIIAGYTESFGAGSYDLYLVKTDANGDTLWTRTYGASGGDIGYSGQQTIDGGYVITGTTKSFGGGKNPDVYLVKTDANGDTIWTRTYGDSDYECGHSVQQTTDGGYILAGGTTFNGGEFYDVWLVRVAGEQLIPDVTIEILPDNPPVTVPQGGSFGYTGTVTNNTEDPQTTDIWVMAVGPLEGIYGPFKELYDFPLDPGQSRSAHFNQRVPNLAPLGFYDYIAYCGDYPSTVMDSSFFQVEVIRGPSGGATGWVLTGSFPEGDFTDLPSDFALWGNYPNPFNAGTVISYELPTSTYVKLEICNLFGQKVATLVDNQQEAGSKSVTWDASKLSSGLYFYKLTAGDFTQVKRMTLLR